MDPADDAQAAQSDLLRQLAKEREARRGVPSPASSAAPSSSSKASAAPSLPWARSASTATSAPAGVVSAPSNAHRSIRLARMFGFGVNLVALLLLALGLGWRTVVVVFLAGVGLARGGGRICHNALPDMLIETSRPPTDAEIESAGREGLYSLEGAKQFSTALASEYALALDSLAFVCTYGKKNCRESSFRRAPSSPRADSGSSPPHVHTHTRSGCLPFPTHPDAAPAPSNVFSTRSHQRHVPRRPAELGQDHLPGVGQGARGRLPVLMQSTANELAAHGPQSRCRRWHPQLRCTCPARPPPGATAQHSRASRRCAWIMVRSALNSCSAGSFRACVWDVARTTPGQGAGTGARSGLVPGRMCTVTSASGRPRLGALYRYRTDRDPGAYLHILDWIE